MSPLGRNLSVYITNYKLMCLMPWEPTGIYKQTLGIEINRINIVACDGEIDKSSMCCVVATP